MTRIGKNKKWGKRYASAKGNTHELYALHTNAESTQSNKVSFIFLPGDEFS